MLLFANMLSAGTAVNRILWLSARCVHGASHPSIGKMVTFTTVNSTITATTGSYRGHQALHLPLPSDEVCGVEPALHGYHYHGDRAEPDQRPKKRESLTGTDSFPWAPAGDARAPTGFAKALA